MPASLRHVIVCLGLFAASPSMAADTGTGKTIAQARCASCHEPADWEGETQNSLESLIKDVVAGRVKHSKTKVELNDQEVANVAAYWLSAQKK